VRLLTAATRRPRLCLSRSRRILRNFSFGFWRRQLAGLAIGIEPIAAVCAVTKRLVLGHAAAAKRDDRAAGETERISLRILDREFTFNPDGTIIDDGDLCCHANQIVAEGETLRIYL